MRKKLEINVLNLEGVEASLSLGECFRMELLGKLEDIFSRVLAKDFLNNIGEDEAVRVNFNHLPSGKLEICIHGIQRGELQFLRGLLYLSGTNVLYHELYEEHGFNCLEFEAMGCSVLIFDNK